MPKKLDYRALWTDARALLAAHKEAIAAIAGFFIFMSAWISAFLVPPLIVENLDDRNQTILEISRYFEANWRVLVPTMLVTTYGSLSLYVLMSGRRFAILPAIIAQDVKGGVNSSVIRTWRVTSNCGWAILFLMLFVAVILRIFAGVADTAIVAICQSIAGEGGVPIVESAVKALFVTLEAVAFIVMLVAVNRQLSAQTVRS